MKIKKKTAMLLSFALGTTLFATTALADITSKSGYDQLKDSLKVTANNCSENFNNFTLDASIVIKDNGKLLESEDNIQKYDRLKNAYTTVTDRENLDQGKSTNYSYSDDFTFIRHNSAEKIYYVTDFTQKRDIRMFQDPFKENGAEDIEKIVDAVVGSLKDQVIVKDNSDGSKVFSGSLTEVQIPSLVNAVASFQLKQTFNGGRNGHPDLAKDIYVKEVSGTAIVNKDGILESILGTAVISGKDPNGQIHDLSVEVLGKLTDINSTKVEKPDLTGQEVVKEIASETKFGPEINNPEKFIGQYKNNIVIEKDGKFIKAGERIIEIKSINNQTITGSYREEFNPGYESYASHQSEFDFTANFEKDPHNAAFTYTTQSGAKQNGNIFLDDRLGKIYFNIPNAGSLDAEFIRDFQN